jgi:RNA 3'-terminal phosphate cyclase
MMFVDGKYKIQVKGSTSKMLDTVDYLINIEKPNS